MMSTGGRVVWYPQWRCRESAYLTPTQTLPNTVSVPGHAGVDAYAAYDFERFTVEVAGVNLAGRRSFRGSGLPGRDPKTNPALPKRSCKHASRGNHPVANLDRRKAVLLSLLAPFAPNALRAELAPTRGTIPEGAPVSPLIPPANSPIPVAFLISEGAVVIDFCGPWEVFESVRKPQYTYDAFNLYTVAETSDPIRASGGLKIVPDYPIANAPPPKVIVIPAQSPASEKTKAWIREASTHADVTMSVCTGAFVLASTGLLSGKSATTHHGAYADLAAQYPDIHVQRGARFVEAGNLATAGGLTSGMDLALRVVERYFGSEVTRQAAYMLEYQGEGWRKPASNAEFAKPVKQTADHPLCPVCGMDPDRSLSSTYQGTTYYFCMQQHKRLFDASPKEFIAG